MSREWHILIPVRNRRPLVPRVPFARLVMSAVVCVLLVSSVSINADAARRVLVLHSYHPGYDWTDSMQATFVERFHPYDDIELYIEYMDTQRPHTADTFDALEQLYRHRYTAAGLYFDLIIATDDPALDFLFERKQRIFGLTPVVFCGVNDFEPYRLEGYSDYTGVNEALDIQRTIDLALELRPHADRFAVISDGSLTGRLNVERFEAIRPRYESSVAFTELYDLRAPEVLSVLSRLGDGDAILYLSLFHAADGGRMSVRDNFQLIKSVTDVPVFSLWDFTIHAGAFAGVVASATEQANTATDLALRVLAGEPPASIPPVMESPNVTMVNYPLLRSSGVPLRNLPPDAVLHDRQISVFEQYWPYIVAALVFVISQSALIAALLRSRGKMRRARRELRERQRELQAITENAPDIITRFDRNLRHTFVNDEGERVSGIPRSAFIGKTHADLGMPSPLIEQWQSALQLVIDTAGPTTELFRFPDAAGVPHDYEMRAVPEFDEHDQVKSVLTITRDITESLRAQEALANSLREKEALLKEVHHRVKNNLQVVASLVSLSDTDRASSDDLLRDVRQRVLAMARIHERLYQSEDFARVDLVAYTQDMVREVSGAYNTVGAQVQVDAVPERVYLPIIQAVPCGLLLTELLTNAYKHAFVACPESPRILVSVRQSSDQIELSVQDNGVGIPHGTDFHRATTTGFTIISALAQQLQAELTVSNSDGTVICLRFVAGD
ncbi:MAG: PAS domain S-box protein [Spirochaetaceae bacterium]|nr:MAG: PAS domain S-box protein [Spirochaetaceae bacterium]